VHIVGLYYKNISRCTVLECQNRIRFCKGFIWPWVWTQLC